MHLLDRKFSYFKFLLPPGISTVEISGKAISLKKVFPWKSCDFGLLLVEISWSVPSRKFFHLLHKMNEWGELCVSVRHHSSIFHLLPLFLEISLHSKFSAHNNGESIFAKGTRTMRSSSHDLALWSSRVSFGVFSCSSLRSVVWSLSHPTSQGRTGRLSTLSETCLDV